MKGKCLIYKKAFLSDQAKDVKSLLEYTDGTDEFDCEVSDDLQYTWKLPNGYTVDIPLNVPKSPSSIMRQAGYYLTDADNNVVVLYEYIFGKFIPYQQYYLNKTLQYGPFVAVILILLVILKLRRKHRFY